MPRVGGEGIGVLKVSRSTSSLALVTLTGGKGPNNQWAHAEYIENPVNK